MQDLLTTITWGTAQPDSDISVHFVPQGSSRDAGAQGFPEVFTSEGWRPAEIASFHEAFARIEAVANLHFNVTSDPDADFQLVLDSNEITDDTLGFFNPPGEDNSGVGVFNGAATSWDTWGGSLDPGGYGFVTIVHEVLHGLGLAHPHDDGGSSTIMTGVTSDFGDYGRHDLNQGIFTTMSYNTGYLTGRAAQAPGWSDEYGHEIGPMALDIAVLQALYGANMTHATDNNTYYLPPANRAGTGWKAIWDAGGTDEIRYGGARDAVIDLRAATLQDAPGGGGYVSGVVGVAGGVTIAHGVMIERASGGAGDDWLTGNAGANTLRGNDGNDRLQGGQGDDLLVGGRGDDRLKGSGGDDHLSAGGGADTLVGGHGDDRIQGGRGDDRLVGGAGADRLYGLDDNDTLFGSGGADRLVGQDGADRLQGGLGDDLLVGGRAADRLFGGAGADRFVFSRISDSQRGETRRDVIGDFTPGTDRIDLSGLDANKAAPGDQAFAVIGGAGFSGMGGELRLVAKGTDLLVQLDINGSAPGAEMELLLKDIPSLNTDDFLL